MNREIPKDLIKFLKAYNKINSKFAFKITLERSIMRQE